MPDIVSHVGPSDGFALQSILLLIVASTEASNVILLLCQVDILDIHMSFMLGCDLKLDSFTL